MFYCKTQVASHITARRRMHLEPTGQPQDLQSLQLQEILPLECSRKGLAPASHLRVHSLSGGSPTALKYPSKQGHSDSPRCVLLLLAGQGRQVTFTERYIPASQPLIWRGGKGEGGTTGKPMDRWSNEWTRTYPCMSDHPRIAEILCHIRTQHH